MHPPHSAFNQLLDPFPHPFAFVTISGAHLYGFPSADSDWDLRGSHLLPGSAFWGLGDPRQTEEWQADTEAGLVEAVSHDLRKFSRLLLRRNGYVLEQVTSPLVVRTSPVHRELLELVPGLLTRNHYHHYRGFYHSERRGYNQSEPRSLKKLLYCFRVLLTGIVLLREGVLEANLPKLNERFGLAFIPELIERKARAEFGAIPDGDRYVAELDRLEAELDRAFQESALPEEPSVYTELDRLIVRARGERGETGCSGN